VAVAVQDSGPGIKPNDFEHIFDPFFTTKSEGIGLGLAICRSIIEVHGGRLWAEPARGQGAIFQLILPIGDTKTARAERDRPVSSSGDQGSLLSG
jgi:signal transduction histidine kinase